jgi:NAD(P)-dependent dehydrogenase (short-subunit alcohol dehydrogenase family)
LDLSQARHAFVTGGASGIGLGISHAFAARGIAVTVADIDNEALTEVQSGFRDRAMCLKLDTRDRASWLQARERAEAAFGPVDILVNNAGIAPDGSELADMQPQSFDRLLAINLTGVFNGIHTFGASIRDLGYGHIVNTSSMSGMVSDHPGLGSYAPSKAGVVALSEVLRAEMAPYGVGVSVLCPGYVATHLPRNTRRVAGLSLGSGADMIDSPMRPHHVAEMVLRGIAENRLYIVTHPDRMAAVERRFEHLRRDIAETSAG